MIFLSLSKKLLKTFAFSLCLSQLAFGEITPNHVYQSTDKLVLELYLFHEANESQPTLSGYTTSKRRPRHVIQKAREVYLRIQDLREMNGLPRNTVPPFPLTEVKPADVIKLVDRAFADMQPLRKIYVVDTPSLHPPFKQGNSPTDVYIHLAVAVELLAQLELPAVVPNNVYQLAMAAVGDTNLILEKRGQATSKEIPMTAVNKQPKHVYEQVRTLLKRLDAMCQREPQLCPPGGINVPPQPTIQITPAHVLDLLNNAIADIGAIKVKAGVRKATAIPPLPSGKTPSDIYNAILVTQNLIDRI